MDRDFSDNDPISYELKMLQELAIPLARRLLSRTDPLPEAIWAEGLSPEWDKLFCILLGPEHLGRFAQQHKQQVTNCNRALARRLRDEIDDKTNKPNREYLNRCVRSALLLASFGAETTDAFANLLQGKMTTDLPEIDIKGDGACACLSAMFHKAIYNIYKQTGYEETSRTNTKSKPKYYSGTIAAANSRRQNIPHYNKEPSVKECLESAFRLFIVWIEDSEETEFENDLLLSLLLGLIGVQHGDISKSEKTSLGRREKWKNELYKNWKDDPGIASELHNAINRWISLPYKQGKRDLYPDNWLTGLTDHIYEWLAKEIEWSEVKTSIDDVKKEFSSHSMPLEEDRKHSLLQELEDITLAKSLQPNAHETFQLSIARLAESLANDENGFFPSENALVEKLEKLQNTINYIYEEARRLLPDMNRFKKLFTNPGAKKHQNIKRSIYAGLAEWGKEEENGLAWQFSRFYATFVETQSPDSPLNKKPKDAREPCQKALAALRSFIARNGTPECCQPALGAMS